MGCEGTWKLREKTLPTSFLRIYWPTAKEKEAVDKDSDNKENNPELMMGKKAQDHERFQLEMLTEMATKVVTEVINGGMAKTVMKTTTTDMTMPMILIP